MPLAFLAFFDGVFAVLIIFVFPGKSNYLNSILCSLGELRAYLLEFSTRGAHDAILVQESIHESWTN